MSVPGTACAGAEMIDINQDLSIFYSGGSGGFVFLHWILLFDQHHCSLPADPMVSKKYREKYHHRQRLDESNYLDIKDDSWPDYADYQKNFDSLDELIQTETARQYLLHADDRNLIKEWYDENLQAVIKNQWNINGPWKSTEHRPDNNATLKTTCVHRPYKVYFFCNDHSSWKSAPGKKILLYTDIRSQLRLAHFKQAWVFFDKPSHQWHGIMRKSLQQSIFYRGTQINNNLQQAFEIADDYITLQQFLLCPSIFFNREHNANQKKLTKNWAQLHPQKLLHKIGLSQLGATH